ncbi:MAG: hypothetical protein EBU52_08775 [Cytophagia bacterium]|nr:hypothetical protein [Cytophagia bacterium]
MKPSIILLFALALALFNCTPKEELEALQSANDSLKNELMLNKEVMITLQEVGSMIDSIDASRKLLKISMVEGASETDYTTRLQAIHEHVVQSEKKISTLEQSLKKMKTNESFYFDMIASLKDELELRLQEIYSLEKVNKELEEKVKVQESDLHDSFIELEKKQQALAEQELKVEQLVSKLNLSESETLLLKGKALEESANRIRFAPAKKKATLREAVGYYRKAADLGNKEAGKRMKDLQGKY